MRIFDLKLALLWLSSCSTVQSSITVTPFLPQSFFFDWNPAGQPVPIPVTEQCQIIHITWSRGTAVGPDPTAPYYLQVYTSVYTLPIIIPVGDVLTYDWAVPFAPGTLYQICMFDRFGNTGGCQATYTVIPASSTPNCANVTFAPQLGVSATVENGPMSQYGWVDQCTDISVTPANGTAPFTLTIAPALHPPYNITSRNNQVINWTVSLSWASPFFISLVDADGNMWANGPLHSGGGGTIACLAGNVTDQSDTVALPIVIGTGIGGLTFGLFLGALVAYIFLRRNVRRKIHFGRFADTSSTLGTSQALLFDHSPGPGQYRPVPTASSSGGTSRSVLSSNPSSLQNEVISGSQYYVEPFTMPNERGRLETENAPPAQGRVFSPHEILQASSTHRGQVYVVHRDSQLTPLTIYHEDGAQIVELPPRYPPCPSVQTGVISEGRGGNDSRSDRFVTEAIEPLGSRLQYKPNQTRLSSPRRP